MAAGIRRSTNSRASRASLATYSRTSDSSRQVNSCSIDFDRRQPDHAGKWLETAGNPERSPHVGAVEAVTVEMAVLPPPGGR